mmetsp:Transcript_65323/g.199939  ORF Transcript_65323/g.199939 Transcript_65323/m.199939 type:complete len:223 (-) Transcript_65323:277-945(-)
MPPVDRWRLRRDVRGPQGALAQVDHCLADQVATLPLHDGVGLCRDLEVEGIRGRVFVVVSLPPEEALVRLGRAARNVHAVQARLSREADEVLDTPLPLDLFVAAVHELFQLRRHRHVHKLTRGLLHLLELLQHLTGVEMRPLLRLPPVELVLGLVAVPVPVVLAARCLVAEGQVGVLQLHEDTRILLLLLSGESGRLVRVVDQGQLLVGLLDLVQGSVIIEA